MGTFIEIIKVKLKQELNMPFLSDLKYSYLIQKIKLLNNRRAKKFY